MAIYSYSEFRDLCGVSDAYISVNVKRAKIEYSDGKKIDTSIQKNADFLSKCTQKIELRNKGIIKNIKKNEPKKKKPAIPLIPTVSEKTPEEKKYFHPEENSANIRNLDGSLPNNEALLTLEKKKLEIEQKEISIRISLLNEAKLRGENIPMDEVKSMIRELSVSFINNYKDSFEKMIIELCFRNKLNANEEGKIKNEFITILNDTHKRVFLDTKHKLEKIKRNSSDNVQLDQ